MPPSGLGEQWGRARDVAIEVVGSRYIDWLLPGLLGMNITSTGL